MSNVWELVQQNITIGQTIHDGRYRVIDITSKRFTMERVATGKTVNVSRGMCERVTAGLLAGTQYKFQANTKAGGFSFTAAICHGVAAALSGVMVRDAGLKMFVLASNASATLSEVA